jgi:hypothetical protein
MFNGKGRIAKEKMAPITHLHRKYLRIFISLALRHAVDPQASASSAEIVPAVMSERKCERQVLLSVFGEAFFFVVDCRHEWAS